MIGEKQGEKNNYKFFHVFLCSLSGDIGAGEGKQGEADVRVIWNVK